MTNLYEYDTISYDWQVAISYCMERVCHDATDAACSSGPGGRRKMVMIYIMVVYKSVLSQECPLNLLIVVSS